MKETSFRTKEKDWKIAYCTICKENREFALLPGHTLLKLHDCGHIYNVKTSECFDDLDKAKRDEFLRTTNPIQRMFERGFK